MTNNTMDFKLKELIKQKYHETNMMNSDDLLRDINNSISVALSIFNMSMRDSMANGESIEIEAIPSVIGLCIHKANDKFTCGFVVGVTKTGDTFKQFADEFHNQLKSRSINITDTQTFTKELGELCNNVITESFKERDGVAEFSILNNLVKWSVHESDISDDDKRLMITVSYGDTDLENALSEGALYVPKCDPNKK